ncbi:PadR family transcriptional regulator [Candidatus Fermentibacteria bacterium]|nr:PadR family transcriptional regulator [Candidatus Fermentibacteria bacterium]
MAQLRKNELAALGLVNREPMHGYALTQAIQHLGLEQWTTVSRSSIYAALRRLAREGAVSITHEREGNAPERTVYHITAAGRSLLLEILREAVSYIGPEDRYFYLGMAFAEALPMGEILDLLARRLRQLTEGMLHEIKDHEDVISSGRCPNQLSIMTQGGIRHHEIEIDICSQLLDMYRSRQGDLDVDRLSRHGGRNGESS